MNSTREEQIKRIVEHSFGDPRSRRICEDAIRKALREVKDEPSGYVLRPEQMDYGDLSKVGKITIHEVNHEVHIEVANFEFAEPDTCRVWVTKAMCWARDVLKAAIENDRIVPGGTIVSIEASE